MTMVNGMSGTAGQTQTGNIPKRSAGASVCPVRPNSDYLRLSQRGESVDEAPLMLLIYVLYMFCMVIMLLLLFVSSVDFTEKNHSSMSHSHCLL